MNYPTKHHSETMKEF